MRTLLFGVLVLGACTPDIAPGAYLCGPERACPDDQACDGMTDTCVLPSQAKPFECPVTPSEVEPNDNPSNAQLIENLTCASRSAQIIGCERDLDREDWFAFDVPAICTTVGVDLRLTFPLPYEILGIELHDSTGAMIATGDACPQSDPDDGDEQRCIEHALTPGGHYTVRILRTGESACAGACEQNRYTLTLQLETP